MMAFASIGSPSVVPVPWASIASMSPASSRASASALRMTRSWAGPLGAVRPLLAPSWLIAEPRITASTWCPLRSASDRRSSRSSPTPSDKLVPSAESANALTRPSGDSACCRLNSMIACGVAMTVTPPAIASSHSPRRRDWAPRCIATSDEEQAVSTEIAGPVRPSVYAIRPDATLPELPLTRYPSVSAGRLTRDP